VSKESNLTRYSQVLWCLLGCRSLGRSHPPLLDEAFLEEPSDSTFLAALESVRTRIRCGTHLRTSFKTHSKYGREGRSSIRGNRFLPMTESISSWAFLNSRGLRTIAKTKACIVAMVWNGIQISMLSTRNEKDHAQRAYRIFGRCETRAQLRAQKREKRRM